MLIITQEKLFKKDTKKFKNNIKVQELVNSVILKLANGEQLEEKYRNHPPKGKW